MTHHRIVRQLLPAMALSFAVATPAHAQMGGLMDMIFDEQSGQSSSNPWTMSLSQAWDKAQEGVKNAVTGSDAWNWVQSAKNSVSSSIADYKREQARETLRQRQFSERQIRAIFEVQDQEAALLQASAERDRGGDPKWYQSDQNVAGIPKWKAEDPYVAGMRVASGEGFVRDFEGKSDDGSIGYSGRRYGGYIVGNFWATEGTEEGSFAGAITKTDRVTGRFNSNEGAGTFSGTAKPDLSTVFGNVDTRE